MRHLPVDLANLCVEAVPGRWQYRSLCAQASREWVLPFATDFSGMDMTSFALGSVLLGDIGADQCWASDIWDQARAVCSCNHAPGVI